MGLVRKTSHRQQGNHLRLAEAKGGKWLQGRGSSVELPVRNPTDPRHSRALSLNVTLLDSLQCAPDCARDRSKRHFSLQFLRRLPPQNKRKREVLYSQFVAIFVGMSTTRTSVLYLHALCQGTTLISTPETWYKVILNMRGLGEPVLRTAVGARRYDCVPPRGNSKPWSNHGTRLKPRNFLYRSHDGKRYGHDICWRKTQW